MGGILGRQRGEYGTMSKIPNKKVEGLQRKLSEDTNSGGRLSMKARIVIYVRS